MYLLPTTSTLSTQYGQSNERMHELLKVPKPVTTTTTVTTATTILLATTPTTSSRVKLLFYFFRILDFS